METAAYALNLLHEHVGKRPIVAVVYSHTHSDHFGGVKGVISEEEASSGRVKVIAPAGFTEWVLKEQGLAAEGMASRNGYMYGENLAPGPTGIVDTGLGQAIEGGEVTFIEPTDIIGPQGGCLTIDGIDLEFMFAPGEAPTGMHCYIPKHRTLHVADNCYMCLHNVYAIRGAFPRDAMQWADSVARSLQYEETEILVSGHNWPVFGRSEVRTFLAQQRDGIRYMHDQTLRLMSHGYVPSEIADVIEFPPSLARLWHLRGYYGTLKHNVRGIYAYYLGWYDGNPATLDPLPPRDMARKTLEYMGGVDAVLERAGADLEAGNYRWVVHVLDQVRWALPEHREARELAAAAHTQLGYGAENATWRNAYLSAARELPQRPAGDDEASPEPARRHQGHERAAGPECAERQAERFEGGRRTVRHQLARERYRGGLSLGADQRGPDQPRRRGSACRRDRGAVPLRARPVRTRGDRSRRARTGRRAHSRRGRPAPRPRGDAGSLSGLVSGGDARDEIRRAMRFQGGTEARGSARPGVPEVLPAGAPVRRGLRRPRGLRFCAGRELVARGAACMSPGKSSRAVRMQSAPGLVRCDR